MKTPTYFIPQMLSHGTFSTFDSFPIYFTKKSHVSNQSCILIYQLFSKGCKLIFFFCKINSYVGIFFINLVGIWIENFKFTIRGGAWNNCWLAGVIYAQWCVHIQIMLKESCRKKVEKQGDFLAACKRLILYSINSAA